MLCFILQTLNWLFTDTSVNFENLLILQNRMTWSILNLDALHHGAYIRVALCWFFKRWGSKIIKSEY